MLFSHSLAQRGLYFSGGLYQNKNTSYEVVCCYTINMKKKSGDFGKLVKNYQLIRPNYPSKIIKDIYSSLKTAKPVVLDLGCGTGISTRQLVKKDSKVFGLDIDEKMLLIASKNQKNIEYIKANAEELPFDNSFFDLVTMFTSFHWFANRKTLKEIKRVLKPKRTVCIIQPKHTAIFINDHKEIIEKALGVTLKTKYSTKNFEDILVKNNFKIINNKVYKVVYKYTLEQFLKLLQTYSIWNEVPASKRKLVLNLFRKHYRVLLKNGFIHDMVDLELISARSI